MKAKLAFLVTALVGVVAFSATVARAAETKTIASDAYIYGYPLFKF